MNEQYEALQQAANEHKAHGHDHPNPRFRKDTPNYVPPPDQWEGLRDMFRMQDELNDLVFRKNNIQSPRTVPAASVMPVLRMRDIIQAARDGRFGPNDLPCTWLRNYSKALAAELAELDAELPWKWWSKDKLDIQNIRVEIVDLYHFLNSLAMAAGMTPGDVMELYRQKYEVNIKRQQQGYSKATKDESDNRGIVLGGAVLGHAFGVDPAVPGADLTVEVLQSPGITSGTSYVPTAQETLAKGDMVPANLMQMRVSTPTGFRDGTIDELMREGIIVQTTVPDGKTVRLFKIHKYLKETNLVRVSQSSDIRKDEFFRPDELIWPDGPLS